jgi:hypothetical protein
MKIAKFFAWIFALLGTLLLLGSVGLCLFSLDAKPWVEELPQGAVQCSEQLGNAVTGRDYEALEAALYGQPKLGLAGKPEEELAGMVWDLAQLNLQFSWQGNCYVRDGSFCRDASVTYMDISSVLENLPTRAHALLTQRVEEAETMEELYDTTGEFRKELVDQVMKAALTQCCMEDARTVTVKATVELVHRDGQWWAVPDRQLLTALSCGVA